MEILTNNHKYDTLDSDASSAANSFRVTDIRAALRDENRVNIFLDGKFSFSLDLSQVVDYKVKVGKRLSAEEVEELKHASAFSILYQRTLEWVFMRPRSVRETRDYLRLRKTRRTLDNRRRLENAKQPLEIRRDRKLPTKILPEILDEDIEAVISRLVEKNYLNDENFAKYFLENRLARKGASERRLREELMKKGIDKRTIDAAFADTPRDEKDDILKIIEKKRRKYPDDQKLKQYLLRQGFHYDSIIDALATFDS